MARKRLQDMNLIDNFLFWALLSNREYGPKAAQYILETILRRPVGEVTIHAQDAIHGLTEKLHGVRLDAYVESSGDHSSAKTNGDLYDLEPDNKEHEKESLPFRTRYYHTMIDSRCLNSGEDYSSLRKAYVIMITSFDPFGRNRMCYTVKSHCLEEPDLPYEDGAYTLYLYVDGDPGNLPAELVQFLTYMKNTTRENAIGQLADIQSMVENLKKDKEVQNVEMKFHEFLESEIKEAREEERANTLLEKMRADAAEQKADAAEKRIKELEQRITQLENSLAVK